MKVIFLGTAGGCATKTRNTTALAIEADGRYLLFDCGDGVYRQMLISGVPVMDLEAIFFTHLHPDHFFGLPGLLLGMHISGRQTPLAIHGPAGLETALKCCFEISGFIPAVPLQICELEPGDAYHDDLWAITTTAADHGPNTLSYRVAGESGPAVAISGDTRPSADMAALAKGANLLIHEAMFADELEELAHEKGHTTFSQAAEIAARAGVKQLYLVHLAAATDLPDTKGPALEKARAIFPDTEIANDGDVIEIAL
jgi:ribonuclease Z